MIDQLSNKEQVELFKKWWKNYGRSISLAIVFGLCIGFGWRYWNQYQAHQTERASMLYDQLQVAYARSDNTMIQTVTQDLIKQYSKTPYASLAAFFLAKKAIDEKNNTEALRQFQWVMDHAKSNSLKEIARMRSARVLLEEKSASGRS